MKPYKIKTVCANGAQSDYIVFGKGKQPLVILPGLSVGRVLKQAKAIEEAYAIFEEDYVVYLFERRSNLPGVYTAEDAARDTLAALHALSLTDVCLYGVSQGGMIAMRMAVSEPETVHKLVLASTAARVSRDMENAVAKWIDEAEKGNKSALADAFVQALYSEETAKKIGPIFRLSSRFLRKKDLARFVTLAKGCAGFDVYKDLDQIRCPALVLGAENDRVTGAESSREIANKLGCALFLYPSPYGHAVYDEAPDFKERILSFLSR